MKLLLALFLAANLGMPVMAADDAPKKTKKVCVEQKDAKTGKVKEVCKTIKIHKKFEGTKVPEKAPKKK
jgi:hypothetical protein